ncbi:uncharacterized protein EURHEDRAFT_411251 [Aspergillus ruber CBS 135680]|uniref:Cenp-O kinetochore centromere component-domain-containing protein n=1 Tax=Aspergillus ruber (strain CBS 135680) TaxID=1388766 RepID=A0A017SHK0_ASPRC|nr:uncharacterized protein EURHEDRAFT_411251 [Aspergillus ruber CBS 135680]EYE96099.1 hypothetical protein EURHEDRAFT_411251 [Aspergillus ruber CBS 135680]
MESDLDSDISSIRAEIRALQSRKRFLSSSLLSSDALQKHLPNPSIPIPPSSLESQSQSQLAEASPLVQSANTHSESNHHRIAFSTTAFPFTDPSPYGSSGRGKDSEKEHEKNLLGVRIDVCARNGRFVRPFYVLLKRVTGHDGQRRLRIHRHTIPAFISMQKLERIYLPTPSQTADQEQGEGAEEEELKPWKKKRPTRKPDLHAFVRTLRRELVSWQKRHDAIGLLREKLGVRNQDPDSEQDVFSDVKDGGWLPINSMGLASLSPTALEARYVRLEWEDGRVGRFKLSNTGMVERAVVIGDQGRDKMLEAAMTGGDGRVESMLDRLEQYTTSQS